MNVTEIIRSLRVDLSWDYIPDRYIGGEMHNGSIQILINDMREIYCGMYDIDTNLIDRLRLRWVIWQWKRLHSVKND